ncbi:MAG: hypothetical protein KGQ93_13760 [Cyanobacteria bacterium REEB459]|nr:hypothetical protein [Cyanobacteria bacterium REEB459]
MQPSCQNSGVQCYGQVTLAAGVAISDGVILVADPGCHLVVAAGVCLGRGVLVRASRGHLIIETGANLGSGVLVVGQGRIGAHSCIGSNSTLVDPDLQSSQVVAPGWLAGQFDPLALDGSEPSAASSTPADLPYVYGKTQLEQLLKTLFPYRQPLKANGTKPNP